MVSAAHEKLVADFVKRGVSTPEVFPVGDALVASRAAEAATPPPELPPGYTAEIGEVGGVAGRWVDGPGASSPGAASKACFVYLHGGGYSWMSSVSHQRVAAELVKTIGARGFVPDFRRSPDHPFPAPVEDSVAVYEGLLADGYDPGSILIAGDSAGGGLVISTLMAVRDKGLPLPAGGVSFSPWTDLTVSGGSATTADDPIVGAKALRSMAEVYLAGADPRNPLASPLYGDLKGLPPLHIQVGGRESLLDDARRFEVAAREAGVSVEYIEHPGVIHMWIVFGPDLPESQEAFRLAGAFAERTIGSA